jgi:ATP-binding cassette subfamily B protein
LQGVNVHIEPGEQIAIVGASGSGKSTLLGVILGWHPLRAGRLLIDGTAADSTTIAELREQTVMIDPDLYLWNRSVFDSIRYGCNEPVDADFELALGGSEVLDDLEQMNAGLATLVGENGSRLSGGEGQRLRIARGLVRAERRLVLLDEPFTGMDSAQRARMLRVLMHRWPEATMLCVSHNVSETTGFGRVLVLADGRIVEDGDPAALLSQTNSAYATMIADERALDRRLWDSARWRHHVFANGEVQPR